MYDENEYPPTIDGFKGELMSIKAGPPSNNFDPKTYAKPDSLLMAILWALPNALKFKSESKVCWVFTLLNLLKSKTCKPWPGASLTIKA